MANTLDTARPIDAFVECAMDAFTQPTPRAMVQGFDVLQSRADTHIPNLSVDPTPVDNTADVAVPIIDYDTVGFFLASTPDTRRFA